MEDIEVWQPGKGRLEGEASTIHTEDGEHQKRQSAKCKNTIHRNI